MVGLWRHETVLLPAQNDAIGDIVSLCWDRALWVFEGLTGAGEVADPQRIGCAIGIRDGLRYAGVALGLDPMVAWGVMQRRAHDTDAPPDVRGAALGLLWATGSYDDPDAAEAEAVQVMGKVPSSGDFLAGLFAVAREEVLHAEALVAAIDTRLVGLSHQEFMVMLPPLRLAFGYFPPRERAALAQAVASRHGMGMVEAARLVSTLKVSPETVQHGIELEGRIDQALERWGLSWS